MTVPLVTADAVELGYEDVVAVAESSFNIPSQSVTAIIGPNGSGKSTVLNAIAGLIEPITGTINVTVPPMRIAFVLQSTTVNENLPMSVREVVSMGRFPSVGFYRRHTYTDREAIDTAMEQAGVTALASRQLHTLSGGQRQRVFVAQGLAQEHDLLLLDEPLTGIDLPAARAIDDMIYQERNQGRAVVISTHDLSEARHADHVLLLASKIIAEGPPSAVITRANLTAAYGSSILHPNHEGVFVDDPAHIPATDRRPR